MAKKRSSPWLVFAAIILAIVVGTWTGKEKALFGVSYYSLYDLFGTLFLHALTLLVVPLVASSIITGVARIGSEQSFRRLGIKMFGFYFGTTLLAILIGLIAVNLIAPGISLSSEAVASPLPNLSAERPQLISTFLLEIIPSNIFDALAKGHMLGLIFFSLLFGYAISKIETLPSSTLIHFFQGVFQAMLRITHIVMKFLPFGVFCLVAKVFATTGLSSLAQLALFFVTVLLALATFTFIGLPLLLKIIGRVKPFAHLRAMAPALITAFSTSSSSATLPITIECVEKRAGISNRICSLVIPLGSSINLSGSALYECVAALFVAQVYGLDLTLTSQFLVVLLALITSMGVAGIPSGSLVAILVILKAIGLPSEGIGLFLAVDRLLDMCRTTVNVFSDSCCAVLVARTEGEKTSLV